MRDTNFLHCKKLAGRCKFRGEGSRTFFLFMKTLILAENPVFKTLKTVFFEKVKTNFKEPY